MKFYNPELNTIFDRKELALHYNTCIPENTESFEGWYRLYYDKYPEHNEYQQVKSDAINFVDGKYVQSYIVVTFTLDRIKSMKAEEVDMKFKEIEDTAHVKSSLGFTIDANERANRDIEGLIKVIKIEELESVLFRDYNNNFHKISLGDLEIMQIEVIKNGQYLYQQKWDYLQKIELSTDEKTLIDFNIEFKNMNFGD